MKYLKTCRALFSKKIHFCPKLGKKGPKWPQNRVLWIFWKNFSLVFLGNNLKWKLILFLFHHQSHIWQNSGSRVVGQNAVKLQNSLKCNISRKKWIMKFNFGMQINVEVFYKLIRWFWVCATRHAHSIQNKKFAYLCNIFRKAWGWSWFFASK